MAISAPSRRSGADQSPLEPQEQPLPAAAARAPRKKRLRRTRAVVRTVVWTVLIVASLASIALFAATSLGLGKGLIVISGSMEPTLHTGSYVLAKTVDADTVEVGDIVAVQAPDGTTIIHRAVETAEGPEGYTMLTLRGDANNANDAAPYLVDEALSPVAVFPGLGTTVASIGNVKNALTANPIMVAGLAVGVVLILAAYYMRPKGRDEEALAESATDDAAPEEPSEPGVETVEDRLAEADALHAASHRPGPVLQRRDDLSSDRAKFLTGSTAVVRPELAAPRHASAPDETGDDGAQRP